MEGSKVLRILCLFGLVLQVISHYDAWHPSSWNFVGNNDLTNALNAAIKEYTETIRYQSSIYFVDGNTPFLAADCPLDSYQYPVRPDGTLARILERGTIRFGYSGVFAITFTERVAQDLARYIAREYDVTLKVEFVPVDPLYPGNVNELNQDKFDILFDYWTRWSVWDGKARDEFVEWTCSVDYGYSMALAVGKVNGGISYHRITSFESLDLPGIKVGVATFDSDFTLHTLQNRYPDTEYILYDDEQEFFAAAATGKVNVLLASESFLRDRKVAHPDVHVVAVAGFVGGASMAVRRDSIDCKTLCPGNDVPAIKDVKVYTPDVNQLQIKYTLKDDDRYNMVAVYASYVSDFVEITERISGEIGPGVVPGRNLSFTWNGALSGQYSIRVVANDGVRTSNIYEAEFHVEWPNGNINDYSPECDDRAPYFIHPKASRFHNKKGYEVDEDRHVYVRRPLPMHCSA